MVTDGVNAATGHDDRAEQFYLDQRGFGFRFDWGLDGLRALAPVADIVIVVDVLRFTSAVCAALEAGASIFPYPWTQDDAVGYAAERDAVLAGRREDGDPSLSPTDLLTLPSRTRVVLPSPNGAALSFVARDLGAKRVLAGCLRNASATARHARTCLAPGSVIAVVAAGEGGGDPPGTMRPALEDLLGAGAILAALDPSNAVADPRCSPEAASARASFLNARPRLLDTLASCASGRQLIELGWEDDVATSAALDVTNVVAELVGDQFVAVRPP